MPSNNPISKQFRKPSGLLGRFMLWRMNHGHSSLTDWGLAHITVQKHFAILDIGCGGGKTIAKLAALVTKGKVSGVDYSDSSVAASKRTNKKQIDLHRVEIRQGSVSHLTYPDAEFDLVTAVETLFFWPDLPSDMREVFRVIKPGGRFIVIAEVYKGMRTKSGKRFEEYAPVMGMTLLTVDEHRHLFESAGFSSVSVSEDAAKGWLCVTGIKTA